MARRQDRAKGNQARFAEEAAQLQLSFLCRGAVNRVAAGFQSAVEPGLRSGGVNFSIRGLATDRNSTCRAARCRPLRQPRWLPLLRAAHQAKLPVLNEEVFAARRKEALCERFWPKDRSGKLENIYVSFAPR